MRINFTCGRLSLIDFCQGVIICVGGLGMLVASDHITSKDYPAANMVKGDLFVSMLMYGCIVIV